MLELETNRLLLRQWRIEDLPIFAEINSDALAMEHFPGLLIEQESNDLAIRIMEEISTNGWGFWGAELKATNEYIGFVGLSTPKTIFPFSPCVEIGWRLHPKHWGHGYATEGGKISLEYAFNKLELNEVVTMTAVTNQRSVAVMRRLGMRNTNRNFMHPKIPIESPVAEHVLYKITRNEWNENRA